MDDISLEIFDPTKGIPNGTGRSTGDTTPIAAGNTGSNANPDASSDPNPDANSNGAGAFSFANPDPYPGPKKRGRKPGSKNKASGTTSANDLIDPFTDLLIFAHTVAGGLLHSEVLDLSATEAEKIKSATSNVARHYTAIQMDPKKRDWYILFGVLGTVYLPMMYLRSQELKARKAAPSVVPGLDPGNHRNNGDARPAPGPSPQPAKHSEMVDPSFGAVTIPGLH